MLPHAGMSTDLGDRRDPRSEMSSLHVGLRCFEGAGRVPGTEVVAVLQDDTADLEAHIEWDFQLEERDSGSRVRFAWQDQSCCMRLVDMLASSDVDSNGDHMGQSDLEPARGCANSLESKLVHVRSTIS